jgi:hypothetical protein
MQAEILRLNEMQFRACKLMPIPLVCYNRKFHSISSKKEGDGLLLSFLASGKVNKNLLGAG